jgi:calcineurin-like phosphoesterase family protein
MRRYFTSDTHIGHKLAAHKRGFDSLDAHDEAVLGSMLDLPHRSKLWVLGDIAFGPKASAEVALRLRGNTTFLLGNHDKQGAKPYTDIGLEVIGPLKYKGLWLSHHPIHPQELYRVSGNIHGHIHKDAATPPLPYPYFNVNWDFHGWPVDFEEIVAFFEVNRS